jgi:hypothetical protein
VFIIEDAMQHKQLFSISQTVWQSFSSELLIETSCLLEGSQILLLKWVYCQLSAKQVVVLGVDQVAGDQLATDMLGISAGTATEEDEQDAMIELMNCICGQLDRDHPTHECFSLPKIIQPAEAQILLRRLDKMSEVTAKVGERWFYIVLFEAECVGNNGGME